MLESYLKNRLKEKDILLMTHIVLGYPSFEDCLAIIETMVEAGVDIMELQIPFSEPIADGPVILHANQRALENGATVKRCLDFAGEVATTFKIPFIFMTYYNIPFRYKIDRFVSAMAENNLKGAIIPDLPMEEGEEYIKAMKKHDLAPILIFSPTTSNERMQYLAQFARGFIYCVARKGVTGKHTEFSEQLTDYLSRCRKTTSLPLAVGFGIKEKADIDFLKGKADIAIIGTQAIKVMKEEGISSVGKFIRSLR
ncbi:MAG TPA: tryptophan synthase subunit alpha [Desulfatiglandales bacterium]|nr:tryptophan synthase subunit alpha [Desulfatiglandales bacterium]